MGKLAEYLKAEAAEIKSGADQRKAQGLRWQQAMQDLVHQLVEWLKDADPEGLLRVEQTDHKWENYDLGRHVVKGLSIALDGSVVKLTPIGSMVGTILIPGENKRRTTFGTAELDNGTDRVSLWLVTDGNRDRWFAWTHGGVGRPLDRESFEAIMVSLLQ